MPSTVARIYRFPVKGLQGEPLDAVELTDGQGVPHDRRFAVARGDISRHSAAGRWLPKQWFIMLMRDTALTRVACRLDATGGTIELSAPGTVPCVAAFGAAAGRARIERYLNDCLGPRADGPAYWVEAGEVSLTDVPQNCLTMINLASVRELGAHMGTTLDPLRFRANLYVDGVPAWAEFTWVGSVIRIGAATLRIPARIPRCAATGVDPATGERGVNVVKGLQAAYGHYDMGVYAEVVDGGRIAVGDSVVPPSSPRQRSRLGHWLRFFAFLARSAPTVLSRPR
jgi:uncharacterized protein YcbX